MQLLTNRKTTLYIRKMIIEYTAWDPSEKYPSTPLSSTIYWDKCLASNTTSGITSTEFERISNELIRRDQLVFSNNIFIEFRLIHYPWKWSQLIPFKYWSTIWWRSMYEVKNLLTSKLRWSLKCPVYANTRRTKLVCSITMDTDMMFCSMISKEYIKLHLLSLWCLIRSTSSTQTQSLIQPIADLWFNGIKKKKIPIFCIPYIIIFSSLQ